MPIIFLLLNMLFLWWLKEQAFLLCLIFYGIFNFIKITVYFITAKLVYIFLLTEFLLINILAVKIYHLYDIVWCVLYILVSAITLPLFYRTKEDFIPIASSSCALISPEPIVKVEGRQAVELSIYEKDHLYYKAKTSFHTFDKDLFSHECKDVEIYSFICQMQSAIVGSFYVTSRLRKRYENLLDGELYSFSDNGKELCFLEYKKTCLAIPANIIKELVIVEYALRGGCSRTLGVVTNNLFVELNFAQSKSNDFVFYQMAVSFANSWSVMLRRTEVNLN